MSPSVDRTRILVIADDPLARAGLAAVLDVQPACAVVGQIAAQADLAAEVEAARPDVVLWDLGWNPETMLTRLVELAEELPPVVALAPLDGEMERFAAEAWQAGAAGLLPRAASAETMAAALAAAARQLVVLERGIARQMVALPIAGAPGERLMETLTPRELEVLHLLAEGLPNKAIARHLGISDHTVKFHVNAIMGKLGAQSRTDAVVRATRLGLVLL
jgi:DNA-binding NarL/FixJ family response regulator